MTGIETRTSAPVTLKRTENLESETLKGLYPAGEGAGFAGVNYISGGRWNESCRKNNDEI